MAVSTQAWFGRPVVAALVIGALVACGNPPGGAAKLAANNAENAAKADEPEAIAAPFAIKGEAEGLLLVWYDFKGVQTAQKRSEVPDAQRANVRVDSLNVAPDARLDADHIYVADLRAPDASGSYPVRKASRTW